MQSGYCERTGGEFWAEPLNACTNLAFILAAIAALRWRRPGNLRADLPVTVLIALVFAIGVGSFLFHTVPRRWTLLADVVPIQLFAFGYFALALRRFLRLPGRAVALGTVAFLFFAFGLQAIMAPLLPPGIRGSAGYGAFLLGLAGMTLATNGRDPAVSRLLAAASAVFALSLTLRSLDMAACAAVPFGLHWAWHLLNATTLFLLLRAAQLRSCNAPAGARPR